eukprot:scaffold1509_cov240-Pinguiococcus_pyrenoidosus.AAC.13
MDRWVVGGLPAFPRVLRDVFAHFLVCRQLPYSKSYRDKLRTLCDLIEVPGRNLGPDVSQAKLPPKAGLMACTMRSSLMISCCGEKRTPLSRAPCAGLDEAAERRRQAEGAELWAGPPAAAAASAVSAALRRLRPGVRCVQIWLARYGADCTRRGAGTPGRRRRCGPGRGAASPAPALCRARGLMEQRSFAKELRKGASQRRV